MRRFGMFVAVMLAAATAYCAEAKLLTDQQVSDLESRAKIAEPREQCFLYAEIISQMTERIDHELATGDLEHATLHLNRLDDYTAKLHTTLNTDSKKLKEAEILIRHTALRMSGIAHAASYENREALSTVEAKLGSLESEMMLRVFKR